MILLCLTPKVKSDRFNYTRKFRVKEKEMKRRRSTTTTTWGGGVVVSL